MPATGQNGRSVRLTRYHAAPTLPVTTVETTLALADNLASLLEPALLIITGLIIGTGGGDVLPIFHLGDAMSGMGQGWRTLRQPE